MGVGRLMVEHLSTNAKVTIVLPDLGHELCIDTIMLIMHPLPFEVHILSMALDV